MDTSKNQPKNDKEIPEGWHKTFADLTQELEDGKRDKLDATEINWALEYERRLIPEAYRYPQKGDLYVAKFDQEINFLTAWFAPFTGSGKATLFKGEHIWIDTQPSDEKTIGCYALPVNYSELEQRMVSKTDRNEPDYASFYFSVATTQLNTNFTLLETNFNKEPLK